MKKFIDNHPLGILLIGSIIFFFVSVFLLTAIDLGLEKERTIECLYTEDSLFEDPYGNLWSYSNENVKPGRRYNVVFSDNGTNSIYDDIIVRVLE